MEHLFGRRLPGWPDRVATIARYEEAAGRSVGPLDWYETLALLRSTALMTRLGYLRRAAGDGDAAAHRRQPAARPAPRPDQLIQPPRTRRRTAESI